MHNRIILQSCSDAKCQSFSSTLLITQLGESKAPATEVVLPFPVSKLEEAWAVCDGDDLSFRVFLLSSDGVLAAADSASSGRRLLWHRDEALAAVTQVEMLSMAADDDDGTYDEETSGPERNEAMNVLVRLRAHSSLHSGKVATVVLAVGTLSEASSSSWEPPQSRLYTHHRNQGY